MPHQAVELARSPVANQFLGYRRDAVFELENGSIWRQICPTEEPTFRDRPVCRVWQQDDRIFAEVEGCGGIIRVIRWSRLGQWGVMTGR